MGAAVLAAPILAAQKAENHFFMIPLFCHDDRRKIYQKQKKILDNIYKKRKKIYFMI